ncbi:hypothetical protein N0B16_01800 [Chryseobacterium sp. GMJ5]|uniref:Lipoprotein n=1 Tax=Chryseobacterium gilvum TaxID=2976534 RepID=A0ABT2VT42_9FLAO|nr:hypothetical protein [Chryseobacterium gilvum]MCU7613156.1 hypothetical protein [Chryseobacterium gilvum]
MKQFYKSKSLLRLSFLAVLLLSVVSVFNSCKDDDDDDQFTDHLVQLEAKIVNGGTAPTPPISTFKTVVKQVGTQQETIFNPTGLVWSSGEFFVNSSQSQINLAANAELLNSDSKLIVTIWIDGEIAETDTVVGSGTKNAAVYHSFLEL